MDDRRDERSLGELFGDLSRQLSTLVHQEIELARTEIAGKATSVGRDAAMAGAGGLLLYAAVLGLMATATLALVELGLSAWLSALLVTLLVGGLGVILAIRGRDGLTSTDPVPRRTVETIRGDAEWAKEQVK